MNELYEKYLKENGEVGRVVKTLSWMVIAEGLPGAKVGELVYFENGRSGQVTSLMGDNLEILVLGREPGVTGGKISRSGIKIETKVGDELLGTTVDIAGNILRVWTDKKDSKTEGQFRLLDSEPKGIVGRKRISRQFLTGIVIVDLMIPLGCGQRELLLGDRKTGKSYLLLHSIISQAKSGCVCIYAAVGKSKAEIVRAEELFKSQGVAGNVIIVAASLEDSAGEIYLAPYTAMAMAEYFRDQGRDVFLVLDDMTTHAKFYRELSLISRKFPGRDSYPGDIFHIHSKLLERAGNFLIKKADGTDGEAAITCLPVVETVQGDITGYIQTNMMSMTDGHIYFDSEMFFKGRRPAINPFISVTRVGRQTQTKLARDAGRALFDLFNSYEKTQSFLRFGAELGENSRQILALGEKVLTFFDQQDFVMVPIDLAVVMTAFLLSGLWDGKGLNKMVQLYNSDQNVKEKVVDWASKNQEFNKLINVIRKDGGALLTTLAGQSGEAK